MKENTRFRMMAVRVACVLILASLSVPGAAAAADPTMAVPLVSAVEDTPEAPPVMPDTPRPDPAALSPEAADAAVLAAAGEGDGEAAGDGAAPEADTPELSQDTPGLSPDVSGGAAAGPDASLDSVRNDRFAGQVFDLMNARRKAAGVAPLTWNQQIADISQGWANHLRVATASPSFDWNTIHRADAGGSLLPPGANWYGEIIAFNFSAAQVVDWWMNSTAHRNAMLDPRETHVGVGYVVPTSGPYRGWHLVVSNLAGYPKTVKPPAVSPFSDLVSGQKFLADMNWMHKQGISTGWAERNGTRTYRPFQSISREAMAAFMYRLQGSPKYTAPKKSPFADVSVSNPFYKEISWLASQQISTGWAQKNGTKVFRPHDAVDRDAMAAFLYRLAGSPRYTAPKKSPFVDVPVSHQFYKQISWLAASGISTGWPAAGGRSAYQPTQDVARDAMAAFMKRWAA